VDSPRTLWRLCFSGDGRKLCSGSADGTIHRWSMDPAQAGGNSPIPGACQWALEGPLGTMAPHAATLT